MDDTNNQISPDEMEIETARVRRYVAMSAADGDEAARLLALLIGRPVTEREAKDVVGEALAIT